MTDFQLNGIYTVKRSALLKPEWIGKKVTILSFPATNLANVQLNGTDKISMTSTEHLQ